MENKSVNKKRKVKSVKKSFKKIYKQCVEYLKTMDKNVKAISIIWGVVVLIIVLLIIVCSFNNKKMNSYTNVEKELVDSSFRYIIGEQLFLPSDMHQRVTLEELLTTGYYDKSVEIPDTCTGYAVIFYNGDRIMSEDGTNDLNNRDNYNIEAYINCKDYTTKNYSDYLK